MPQFGAPVDSCEMVFPFRVTIIVQSTVHTNLAHSQLWRPDMIILAEEAPTTADESATMEDLAGYVAATKAYEASN
jgi:hypothetical protein